MKFILSIIAAVFAALPQGCHKKNQGDFEYTFFNKTATKQMIENAAYFISDDCDGWKTAFIGRYNTDSLSIRFEKNEKDTLKNIVFAIDSAQDPKPISILFYEKKYRDGNREFVVHHDKRDTLYCYYTVDKGNKVFLTGGYNFKGTHMEFGFEQQKYYMLYSDSLDRIRGNYLPDFPSLTCVGEPTLLPSHNTKRRRKIL